MKGCNQEENLELLILLAIVSRWGIVVRAFDFTLPVRQALAISSSFRTSSFQSVAIDSENRK